MAVPVPANVQQQSNSDYGWGSFAHDLLNGAIGIEKERINASKRGDSNTTSTIEHYDRNSQNDPDQWSDGSFRHTSPWVLIGGGVLAAMVLITLMKEV